MDLRAFRSIVPTCLVFSAFTATSAFVGCSSSSSNGATPGAGDAGAAEGGSNATGTLSVLAVVVGDQGITKRVDTPAAGVTVGLDLPDGTHKDATTDADGKVAFDAIDWSLGKAAVVGSKDGFYAYGVAGVGPDNFTKLPNGPHEGAADVVLYLGASSKTGPVSVPITFTNKDDPSDYVFVGATTGVTSYSGPDATGTVTLRGNDPFTLVAWDWHIDSSTGRNLSLSTKHFASYDEPAPTAATDPLTIDLTGGTALTPTTAHFHATVPGGQSGTLANTALLSNVTSLESDFNGVFGGLTVRTLGTDNASFDATADYVTVSGQTLVTQYVLVGNGGVVSVDYVSGPIAEGATVSDFVQPVKIGLSASLSAPIDLSTSDPTTTITRIFVVGTSQTYLLVDVPAGETTVTLPKLPDATNAAIAADTSTTGQIASLAGLDPDLFFYRKLGGSHTFKVTP